jgi:hypothetical protein
MYSKLKFTSRANAKKETGLSYLGGVSTSTKIAKNIEKNVLTYVVYLAPANLSGYNVCPMATAECKEACLHASGRAILDQNIGTIPAARIAKTKLFFENREYYMQWLIAEIKAHHKAAQAKGMDFSVRLNGTSDISPEIMKYKNRNILQELPYIQFYDYTKVANRFDLTTKYPNYDLTFSFSGNNWAQCETALKNNVRVAVVFGGELPAKYKGYDVVNADKTDLRYLDENDVICGLKFKKVINKIDLNKSKFIVTEY